MRVAVIGAGGMAASHFKAYQRIPEFEVVAVCDISRDAALRAEKEMGCRIFTDVDDMLDICRPDAVDICLPSFLHYETVMKCLKRNLHIFCEKPMAHTWAEAERILEEAKVRGRVIQIGQVLRYWPEYQYLHETVQRKKLGELCHLLMQRQFGAHEAGSWYMDPNKCKMSCFEMHIHDTDFINSMFGIPDFVDSVGEERPEIHLSYISTRYVYEGAETVIQAEGGWSDSSLEFAAGYRAVFEHGVLEYKEGVVKEYPANEKAREIKLQGNKGIPSDIVGVIRELKEFGAKVEGREVIPLISAESAADTIWILQREQESVQQGKKICCRRKCRVATERK